MYIEWLIIYILYIQGGPKWYCNRVIFKYLTVVFFIGKEGIGRDRARFRRGEGRESFFDSQIGGLTF